MQDFNYVNSNSFEITLELSCIKYPSASELANEWKINKRSLIEYMKMVHIGVKGLVSDNDGQPIQDAEIVVEGLEGKPIRSTKFGEFWRLLVNGEYRVKAVAKGYVQSFLCNFLLSFFRLKLSFFNNDTGMKLAKPRQSL